MSQGLVCRWFIPKYNCVYGSFGGSDRRLLSVDQMKEKFEATSFSADEKSFAHGSGVTACILALGLHLMGHQQVKIYGGSWTE